MTSCLPWLADVYRKPYLDILLIFPAGLRTFDRNHNNLSILRATIHVECVMLQQQILAPSFAGLAPNDIHLEIGAA
jgi:hypothetical protein